MIRQTDCTHYTMIRNKMPNRNHDRSSISRKKAYIYNLSFTKDLVTPTRIQILQNPHPPTKVCKQTLHTSRLQVIYRPGRQRHNVLLRPTHLDPLLIIPQIDRDKRHIGSMSGEITICGPRGEHQCIRHTEQIIFEECTGEAGIDFLLSSFICMFHFALRELHQIAELLLPLLFQRVLVRHNVPQHLHFRLHFELNPIDIARIRSSQIHSLRRSVFKRSSQRSCVRFEHSHVFFVEESAPSKPFMTHSACADVDSDHEMVRPLHSRLERVDLRLDPRSRHHRLAVEESKHVVDHFLGRHEGFGENAAICKPRFV